MKKILRLQLAMVSLALATLQSTAATLAPNATGRHLIAFAAFGANSTGRPGGIYLMRDDNTAMRQLTRFPDVDGTWSNDPRKPLPDGVEVFATDDRGGSQGWDPAGEVTVLRSPHQPWLEIKPHAGVPGQAGPTLKIHSVPGHRVQLELSTNLVTWTTVQEIENSTGEVSVDLSATDLPRSFYRVRSQ